jgi:hypothetical protein
MGMCGTDIRRLESNRKIIEEVMGFKYLRNRI